LVTSHKEWIAFYCCWQHKYAIKALLCNNKYFHVVDLTCSSTIHRVHCCISITKLVTPTCHNVTLYIQCLSGIKTVEVTVTVIQIWLLSVCEHKAHILQSSSNMNCFKFSAVDALQSGPTVYIYVLPSVTCSHTAVCSLKSACTCLNIHAPYTQELFGLSLIWQMWTAQYMEVFKEEL
jgi:hypothetical protein